MSPEVPDLALTLWPEWAWTIATIGRTPTYPWEPKDVENRGWHPRGRLPVGTRIAIHAGAYMGGRPGRPAAQEAREAVVGMLRQQAGLGTRPLWSHELWPMPVNAMDDVPRSAIVCTATIAGFDQVQRTPWDVPGAWHWRLHDVVVLPSPVPCQGAQGLWSIPADIRERLRTAA